MIEQLDELVASMATVKGLVDAGLIISDREDPNGMPFRDFQEGMRAAKALFDAAADRLHMMSQNIEGVRGNSIYLSTRFGFKALPPAEAAA